MCFFIQSHFGNFYIFSGINWVLQKYSGGDYIFDYDLDEVLELLENLDEFQIKESRHFRESNVDRFKDIGLICELLLNASPVQIGKTKTGTYKVVYEHPEQKSKDIYLIIMIINRQEITLKTIYPANRSRRLREYEPS